MLERAGLIARSRDDQRRPARLRAAPMAEATDWLATYRRFWEQSFDALDEVLEEMKFDESWYPGEGLVTADFLERERGKTSTLQLTLRYESPAARDGVLKSPMETGLAASYDALERLLVS